MKKKICSALRSLLAGGMALAFLSAGTALAAPETAPELRSEPVAAESTESLPADLTAAQAPAAAAGTSGRSAAVVDIPEGTTAIEPKQFYHNRDLAMVRIPDSVKTIGESAFEGCTNLTQIILPDSVTTIGKNAFAESGISKAVIGNGVTNIGDGAFLRCENLDTLTLGDHVQVIGTQAFWGCTSLLKVDIPDSVTQIKGSNQTHDSVWDGQGYQGDLDDYDGGTYYNGGAFGYCTSLTSVSIGSGLTALEGHTFRGCINLQEVTFGSNLRTIGPMAFRNTASLKKLELPDSLIEIGVRAFKQSGIAQADLGSSLTKIDDYAFQSCKNLTTVPFSGSLRTIGAGAFSGCVSLEEALLPDSVSKIEGGDAVEAGAFYGCSSLTKVRTGTGLLSIGPGAFRDCTALESAVIGPRTQSIGGSAFRNCRALEELVIPDSTEALGYGLAMDSGVKKVSIGSGALGVPENAFRNCRSLTDLTIGPNVTTIEAGAFAGCQSLKSVVIPNKVDIIGAADKDGAFKDCLSLETVTLGVRSYPAKPTFDGCWGLRTIRYPGTQAEWDQLGFTLPAGAQLELISPLPSASAAPSPSASPSASAEPSPSASASMSAGPSGSPGIALPASAVQISGCSFVYAGALVPVNVKIGDSRITSLSGELRCTGFSQSSVTIRMTRGTDGWQGGDAELKVSAAAGQFVSCTLTNISVTAEGQTISLPDRFYNAPVRQFNLPANYLTAQGPSSISSGETISVVITGRGEGISGNIRLQGLEVTDVSADLGKPGSFVLFPDYGFSSLTYTCRVTAGPGERVSFRLTDVELAADDMVLSAPGASWEAAVPAGPPVLPAPGIPAAAGYQSGRVNGRIYYARTSGSGMLFYQRKSSGAMGRVSAPYVTDQNGTRFYPLNYGGAVLFPRLSGGRLSAYCIYADGLEVPVLSAGTIQPVAGSVLQTCAVNGKTYYARTAGAGMLFYQRKSNGSLGRVSAPYVTGSDGIRYYPVNCGGMVLIPKLQGGVPAGYAPGGTTAVPVLTAVR